MVSSFLLIHVYPDVRDTPSVCFYLFILYWSIADQQCYYVFCIYTHTDIYIYIYALSQILLHGKLLQGVQQSAPWHTVGPACLCCTPWCVSVNLRLPISPSTPSSLTTPSRLSVCASLFLFRKCFHLGRSSDSTSKWCRMVFVFP